MLVTYYKNAHKVAESTALRKAFPETHQGMYDESEVIVQQQEQAPKTHADVVFEQSSAPSDKVSYANRPKKEQEVIDYSELELQDASHLL